MEYQFHARKLQLKHEVENINLGASGKRPSRTFAHMQFAGDQHIAAV
jgi:hypothetical protein